MHCASAIFSFRRLPLHLLKSLAGLFKEQLKRVYRHASSMVSLVDQFRTPLINQLDKQPCVVALTSDGPCGRLDVSSKCVVRTAKTNAPPRAGFLLQRGCLMQFALTNSPSTSARDIDGSQR